MEMKKILCISQSCFDIVFGNLPKLPALGEEVFGDVFELRAGGGANTAISLGRLDVPVSFLTRVGDDSFGQLILEELKAANVSVDGRIKVFGSRTAVSAVLSTREDRGFASFDGTGGSFLTKELLEEEIRKADIVHTFLGHCYQYPIAQLCESFRKELSLDTGFGDSVNEKRAWEILGCCDWLKVNQSEAERLTGKQDPICALKELAGVVKKGVVITLGEQGSIGMEGCKGEKQPKEYCLQKAIPMGAFRDSCGAGDSYAAGFLFGIAQGYSFEESMKLGSIVSGLCVTWYGGNSRDLNSDMVRKHFSELGG